MPIDLMIHDFLNTSKIIDYKHNTYSIAPNQAFSRLGLLKNKCFQKLNFPTFFFKKPRPHYNLIKKLLNK